MTGLDAFEELLAVYESGQLRFTPATEGELAKFKAAARATPIANRAEARAEMVRRDRQHR